MQEANCNNCQEPVTVRVYWDTREIYSGCDRCMKAWDGLPRENNALVIAISCQNCNAPKKSALRLIPFFKTLGFFHCVGCNAYWEVDSEKTEKISRKAFLAKMAIYRRPGDPDPEKAKFF